MATQGFTLFETPIGSCGIAWGERGIVGLQLPEATEGKARQRMARRFPEAQEGAPPPDVRRAIDAIVALLNGGPSDLSAIALDMDGVAEFEHRVYDIARAVPPGETLTYGEVAARLGDPAAARDVGQALGKNPFPIVVPCHRILAARGKAGGFSARGGVATKMRMLTIERARTNNTPALFDDLPLATRRR
ncbi:MAG: methylated-DNA--[protein]-cysteine S-methyltransferase [Propylenella sp.]